MSDLLANRIALVTGGARGIGLAVARGMLREGARVVLADVDAATVEATGVELEREAPGRVLAVTADVTDEASTEALADAAERAFGTVDVAVANAGILLLRHAVDTDVAAWRKVIDVNLTGAFITAKVFAKRMLAAGVPGRIIFTSSLFGVRGGVENSAYSATKWALLGITECMAAELGGSGITVNSVCPGQVDTEMMRQLAADRSALRGTTPEEEIGRLTAKVPMGRLADPAEIADVYVFLASHLARYVNGRSIVVDGGWLVG
ncbi:MAG: SDR family NAD(P)-dependent oxidoreductase [Actinomycetota bacterium]